MDGPSIIWAPDKCPSYILLYFCLKHYHKTTLCPNFRCWKCYSFEDSLRSQVFRPTFQCTMYVS
jgi:hypothetical protein